MGTGAGAGAGVRGNPVKNFLNYNFKQIMLAIDSLHDQSLYHGLHLLTLPTIWSLSSCICRDILSIGLNEAKQNQ